MGERILTVRLKFEQRGDSVYVLSDDLPGLWLWGNDPEDAVEDVIPAIQALCQGPNGEPVEVKAQTGIPRGAFPQFESVVNTYEVYSRARNHVVQ